MKRIIILGIVVSLLFLVGCIPIVPNQSAYENDNNCEECKKWLGSSNKSYCMVALDNTLYIVEKEDLDYNLVEDDVDFISCD